MSDKKTTASHTKRDKDGQHGSGNEDHHQQETTVSNPETTSSTTTTTTTTTATTSGTENPPPLKKTKKEEYLKFQGRREPRVGDEFQVALLPPSPPARTGTNEQQQQQHEEGEDFLNAPDGKETTMAATIEQESE